MTDQKKTDPTVRFYHYLKRVKGLSNRTIYHYMTYHRHYMNQKINQASINRFLQSKNNNTVCRSYLKAYLEFKGLDNQFKIPKAKTGIGRKRIIRYITKDEIKRIIQQSFKKGFKQGIMMEIMYYGALRRAELSTIKTNSFKWDDLSGNYVQLSITGKGKKDRVVLIPVTTVQKILRVYYNRGLINNHMGRNDILSKLSSIDDNLFNYGERSILNMVHKVSRDALGKIIRPHEIRHARATHLLEDGNSERTIQKYLGHSSLAITEIYLHTTEKQALSEIESKSKTL